MLPVGNTTRNYGRIASSKNSSDDLLEIMWLDYYPNLKKIVMKSTRLVKVTDKINSMNSGSEIYKVIYLCTVIYLRVEARF